MAKNVQTTAQFVLISHASKIMLKILQASLQHNPVQYPCLENPMDGGAWWAAVHGISKSRTGLSDFIFTFHFHALEKEMATHSSILACRIPGTGEPGGLPSMGSHRVGHDWSDLAAAAAAALSEVRAGSASCFVLYPQGYFGNSGSFMFPWRF